MLKIDLHIHSLHSGHGYGTIYEILNHAADLEMSMIAVTDHGPAFSDSSGHIHFRMGKRAPKNHRGVRLLWGCEANIVDHNGTLDLDEQSQEDLDIILCNFHRISEYKDQGIDGNTKTMLKVLQNPRLKILTHPLHPQFPYDYKTVIKAAAEAGVLLELNMAYLGIYGKDRIDDFAWMVETVKRAGGKFIVNTDSHFLHEIGDDTPLREHYSYLGLSKEIIINNDLSGLFKFLNLEDDQVNLTAPANRASLR
ncbi:MAG: PHP domain-containing protein [Spirochaetia bacterium]